MNGATPADLRSDAWIIRQNARRLLSALREFLDSFAGPRAANLARRVAARVEHGVSRDAVALTAIDGIGATRANKLATGGLHSPADIIDAGVTELQRAGLAEGVAKQIVTNAREFPDIDVRWESLPDEITRGANEICEVTIRNVGGSGYVGIRITVNNIEMTATETYLDNTTTVPVGVFGADTEKLKFTIEITFPAEPLHPVRAQRAVSVVDNE
jgi:Sec63 Brl domain.